MLRQNTKITILVVGYIHRDPVTIVMLRELIHHYQSQHVKMVMCEEDSADASLVTRLSGNKIGVQNAERLMKLPDVKKLLIDDAHSKYSHFPLATYDSLAAAIKKRLPNTDSLALDSHVWCLLRKNYYSESTKLTETLMKYNIPYYGIENSLEGRNKMMVDVTLNGDQAYVKYEQLRIETMTANILKKGLTSLEGDGLVIVKCGANHSLRLAANIIKRINEQPALANDIDIQVIPTTWFSPYVMDGMSSHQVALAKTAPDDSPEMVKLQLANPVTQIQFTEIKGLFSSDAISTVNEKILSHLPSVAHYFVPDWTSEKSKLIVKHGGVVIEVKDQLAEIAIESSAMKRALREAIGVSRRLLTLKGDVGLQLAALAKNTDFTVESKFKSSQYLVTLPTEKLSVLEEIIKPKASPGNNANARYTQFHADGADTKKNETAKTNIGGMKNK